MALSNSDKIFIDVNDEINFVVEKILASEKERVILVAPQNAIIVSSLVSMKILAKQIAKSKKVLVLVTEDQFGLQLAEQASTVAINKVSEITPELWESAQVEKEKFKQQMEDQKERLLRDRGAIEDKSEDLRSRTQDSKPKTEDEGDVAEQTDGDDAQVESVEVEIVEEEEESSEESAVEEDAEQEDIEEVEESELENEPEEEPVGAIQRKRLDPKLVEVGGFQILAGGDISSVTKSGNISGEVDPSNMESEENAIIPDRRQMVESKKEKSGRAFTGKDWTKYTQDGGGGFNLQKLIPSFLKRDEGGKRLTPEERSAANKRKLRIAAIAIVLLILLFAAATYVMAFVLSSVEITIGLKTAEVPVEQQVIADIDAAEVEEETLTIPAQMIEETDLSISASGTASGTAKRGTKAAGLIEIWNFIEEQITVPAGTVLVNTTTNLKYVLKEDAIIPAAKPQSPGSSVLDPGGFGLEWSIQAEKFGEEYNITESGTSVNFKVGDYSTEDVEGKRFNDITGGTSEEFRSVSQEDYDGIYKSLVEKLEEQGIQKIGRLVPQGFRLIEGTEKFEETNASSVPEVGEEATEFSVSVEGKVTAIAVREEDLQEAIALIIAKNDENGLTGEFEIDDVSDAVVTDVTRDGTKVTFKVTSSGNLKSKITEDDIKQAITGMTLEQAEDYIVRLDETESVKITYSPGIVPDFLRRIPNDTGKIQIIF